MIAYPGQDRSENYLGRLPDVSRSYRALMMFRAGKDTTFIAKHFKCPEARILRWITEERSRENDLPNPYGVQS